jgi:arylformamidase
MTFIDISPPIDSSIHVWPGDTPFMHSINLDMKTGANITLSEIHTTVHVGAHADAPAHYVRDGMDIASRRLEFYIGRCVVLRVPVHRGERVIVEHLDGKVLSAPRVLLRTGTFPEPRKWNNDSPTFLPLWSSISISMA